MMKRITIITIMAVSAIAGCSSIRESDSARQSPITLGKSGYSLHFSESGKETAVALITAREGRLSLTINIQEHGSTLLTTIEREGVVVMLFDRNGDGIPDEGIERDTQKGTFKKFLLETHRSER
ncbi:MAG: hypothetical protein Q8M02_15255 [Candidatus Didemnitutus sp.]|nr:hypothetical protein [Candidatus Didemnitutus sp.]